MEHSSNCLQMNTAARVESNGMRDRIHISKDTADNLLLAGKKRWIAKREDAVYAKGKGKLETYWLTLGDPEATKSVSSDEASRRASANSTSNAMGRAMTGTDSVMSVDDKMKALNKANKLPVKIQPLPEWNSSVLMSKLKEIVADRNGLPVEKTNLPPEVVAQISLYVTEVAKGYNGNPFHNFEHVRYPCYCQ